MFFNYTAYTHLIVSRLRMMSAEKKWLAFLILFSLVFFKWEIFYIDDFFTEPPFANINFSLIN